HFKEEKIVQQDVNLLRIPGPTPIPPSIQQEMNKPMIGHRGPETKELVQRIKPRLKRVFGTKEDVLMITASGTGGLETAAVNVAARGDEVLVLVSGAFGDRFAKICEAYQFKTHRLDTTWGEVVNVDEVKQFLEQNNKIKAVFMTYCETSTGILNPIDEISKVVRE